MNDLMAERLAKRRWFTMINESRTSTRIKVSIYKMSEEMASRELSPLTLQAIIEAQQDGSTIEEDLIEEIERMDDHAKLRFYAKVISGPLKRMNTFGKKWTTYYFKPLEISKGNWEWCAWHSREDYDAGLEAVETYPLLSISVVVADPTNPNCFYVKYHKGGGDFGLLFKRVDRNRDVWSDSLYEFIQRTRDIYFKTPNRERVKISHKRVKRCKSLEVYNDDLDTIEKHEEIKSNLSRFKRLTNPIEREEDEDKVHKHVGRMAQHMYMSS
ncbi:transmembrane protein, putative [Babesia ovis]|uniref:Transmembrane protein, putative n=1 Tax=Babesia ovis TaxID=5869 RepID=A0A9W5TA88_BABOV|nr:transmembrane protein, putative [Babesia ovis]